MRRLWAAMVLAVLVAPSASANEYVIELSRGRSLLAVSALAGFELPDPATHLSLCYGLSSSGGGLPAVHQLCAGVDRVWGDHWMGSAIVSFSPRTRYQVQITDGFRFTSENSSLGASLALAYHSGGWSEVEFELDGTLGLSSYSAPHTWTLRTDSGEERSREVRSGLVAVQPGLGGVLFLGDRLELSLRGSYFLYSGDPLSLGRISDEEISAVVGRIDRYYDTTLARTELSRQLAESFANTAGGRLLQADAVSGMAIAPLQFQLRPGVAYRFNRILRAQLGYAFEKYVPGEGVTHVLSTRWTVRATELLRCWASAALQLDRPQDAPGNQALLVSVGAELAL
ncbi:MAG: hypothetical protein M3Y59_01515 [Myxococcota bacterium]|nr:hypothetical protein [Myxococcota bacterium]